MKIFIKLLIAGLPILLVSSCKKYLDVTPDNVATLNSSFTNANETQAYLFGCYNNLQNLSDVRHNAGFTTSGEVIFPINLNDRTTLGGGGGDAGFTIMQGLQNSGNPLLNFWDGYNMGLNLWQSIRMCNTFLDNVNTPLDLPAYQKTRWIAEAKFLKAYYHYWLIRMYGPIPIADVALPINATSDQVRLPQQTVDSCFNYVVHLLDTAIAGLPAVIQNTAAEEGRITSTIALAVKAEGTGYTGKSPVQWQSGLCRYERKGRETFLLRCSGPRKMATGAGCLQGCPDRRQRRRRHFVPVEAQWQCDSYERQHQEAADNPGSCYR